MTKAVSTSRRHLIKRLRAYNAWRRGAETPQPDPFQLGRDLDQAIAMLTPTPHNRKHKTHER